VVIEDGLARLRQENERLRLLQEQMARRKTIAKRPQVMQQQIEQERAIQAEHQQAIDHFHHQEGDPVVQETLSQQYQPQQLQQNAHFHPRQGNIDIKSPPADNLQLAPWPIQYRTAPVPKYYEESDP
jgi:hypothetical protein